MAQATISYTDNYGDVHTYTGKKNVTHAIVAYLDDGSCAHAGWATSELKALEKIERITPFTNEHGYRGSEIGARFEIVKL